MAAPKKKVVKVAKLQFIAGQAKPGPALAGVGIKMPEFTKAFNDQTRDRGNEPVPVAITVYADKSFDFKIFTAPASFKLLQAAKLKSGSANSKAQIIGTIKLEQLEEIAKYKMVDLNTRSLQSAMATIAGTAKNMGILIEGWDDIAAANAAAAAERKAIARAEKMHDELEAAQHNLVESKDKEIEVVTVNEKEGE
ncbi:large subunit ribosomal protein L11 [Mycoplasma testudineum]|uniref:Large ribosomal subunit protein uL11 n=1 Tax=Mycoplasma testudineum TaxID=244584 RepID=A0A4R6IDR1_9MOLU|nr:50S ribosomal protein L11 [Mycoplasma testudineum]OYD26875.1 50S ribosomal protein L11 [Mycoplasma testudineum]TDO20410.1 large subunit ribosomal protein L11 [Mycoplasma testudineum]